MTAPAPEKAAPIPAEVLALAENAQHRALKYVVFKDPENVERAKAAVRFEVAIAILADRVLQEERIREDERDRLYEAGLKWSRDVCDFLEVEGAKVRARLRGDAS